MVKDARQAERDQPWERGGAHHRVGLARPCLAVREDSACDPAGSRGSQWRIHSTVDPFEARLHDRLDQFVVDLSSVGLRAEAAAEIVETHRLNPGPVECDAVRSELPLCRGLRVSRAKPDPDFDLGTARHFVFEGARWYVYNWYRKVQDGTCTVYLLRPTT